MDKNSFQVKSIINELAPILILYELYLAPEPRTAAKINKEISLSFSKSLKGENFKYQPSLLYNLMKYLLDNKYVEKNLDNNCYKLTSEGREFFLEQFKELTNFVSDLDNYIKNFK